VDLEQPCTFVRRVLTLLASALVFGFGPCAPSQPPPSDGGEEAGIIGSDAACNCVEGGHDSGGGDAPLDEASDVAQDSSGDAETGPVNWAKRLGDTGETDVASLALDPTNGDIVITGGFGGTTDLGGGTVTGGGGFLARYDSAGTYKWAHVFSEVNNQVIPYNVAVDTSGNVLVGGQFYGTTDFGGGAVTATGDLDIFLAKFTAGGDFVWVKHFGVASSSVSYPRAVFDGSGKFYVVAESNGVTLDVGCGPMTAGEMFVAEFTANGSCVWSKAFGSAGGSNHTLSEWISLDPVGNVFVAGGFYGTTNLGTGPMSALLGMDLFVQKLDASGTVLWAKSFGVGAFAAMPTGVGTDSSGNLLLDGNFSEALDLGCGTLWGSGLSQDMFLAKLDGSGRCIWSKSFVASMSLDSGPLAVDSLGSPVITGSFSGVLNFGGGPLNGASQGNGATYIAKFSPSGAYQWAYAGGPPSSTALDSQGLGIGVSASAIVTTGTYLNGTLSLAGAPLPPAGGGGDDVYLASFKR
jgi:hypothetical protein